MPKTIALELSEAGIDRAIRELEAYKADLERKCTELCERLASLGATRASLDFSRVFYVGDNDVTITVEPIQNGYAVIADGESVLFLEFGAGVTYGYGHPKAGEFGMGPGTYPSDKGHWDDPDGWYIPKAKGGGHTYGNPPAMSMYNASMDMRQAIERVAREVFGSDRH